MNMYNKNNEGFKFEGQKRKILLRYKSSFPYESKVKSLKPFPQKADAWFVL